MSSGVISATLVPLNPDPVMSAVASPAARTALFDYPKYWAECFGIAPFLPMSRAEMDALGWDSCDIILVTGDAYVDHPSFGMALIGRLLEAQGFRTGIIAQPDWRSTAAFEALGRPTLFFGITAGNMDSMINRYTAERRSRSDDAYTPGGRAGKRPDRCSLAYAQRCREAYPDVPLVLGGIEASLRRIAHYDYWQDTVRRSLLLDTAADILLYGNAERAVVELAHRLARGEAIADMTDIRGSAFVRRDSPADWCEIDSTRIDRPGRVDGVINPYINTRAMDACERERRNRAGFDEHGAVRVPLPAPRLERARTVIRLPSHEKVRSDAVLYAHASRVLHLETNPGNARALVQQHGAVDIWLNPPPIPLSTAEMDYVYGMPFARVPHPRYRGENIPAWEMIRFSVNIMRGCFGGCTFCSITEHEGRIIQNRSQDSILREIEDIRDKVPGFTGVISDLGGPTANMYRIACRNRGIEAACRKPSCVYPGICPNLDTDHSALTRLYREARRLPGIKKVLIASGLRYDLAVRDPEYVKELVTHHVGGYLKIAPEHTEEGPLSMMMKPGVGAYDVFRRLFEKFSIEARKEQYLIPYFIAAHPGTRDEDMINLALWLKQNGFRADQVQAFYPSPMATATAMYHSGRNPLHRVRYKSGGVDVVKDVRRRRLHKAFLRYHDPQHWPLLRETLLAMGRADLIGDGPHQLIPHERPSERKDYRAPRRKNSGLAHQRRLKGVLLTRHTGLPPWQEDGRKNGHEGKGKRKRKPSVEPPH
jgi:uncharacterized radical SAM protein YgiQ